VSNRISKIPNNVQDRNSEAWIKLCEYVDELAESEIDEFVPREHLGDELFAQIYTLPESISKLKRVKKIGLYGSALKRVPPEIGQMESLEYFDPYTSYDLNWFPYELTRCKKLFDSRISTRALFGNYKNRMGFPRLDSNPVRYYGNSLECSVCTKMLTYEETNQKWITLRVGTDTIPLLVNLCSNQCEVNLPDPPKNYIEHPHKGGADLKQPLDENELWKLEMATYEREDQENKKKSDKGDDEKGESIKLKISDLRPIKLIRKIWEK